MDAGRVSIAKADGVQTLRLVRPAKKNALDAAMYRALTQALIAGDAAPDIAVHVLLGSDGVFTAGNDIGEFLAGAEESAGATDDILALVRLLPRIGKPMVAGVDGLAVGIGTTMLLHCDLVFATPDAQFSTPFLALGLVPEAASSLLMPMRMGYARAFEMLVLGTTFSSERMREAGVVNAVVPAADLENVVASAARSLASKPPAALAAARALMRGDVAQIAARTEEEARVFLDRMRSPEAKAAVRAFLDRRRADPKGPRRD